MLRYRTGLILTVLHVVLAAGPRGAASESDPAAPYDVLSYHLRVSIDFENSPGPDSPYRNVFSPINELQAEASIRLRNVSAQSRDEISLVLHRLMNVSGIATDDGELSFQQELRGLDGAQNFQVMHLKVRWSEPLAPGAEATVSIRYSGQLVGYPESGMLYLRETLDPDFTILRGETFCYPQVTLPDHDAASAARRIDFFDQQLEVTVPDGHIVITGGRAIGITEKEGKKTFAFASDEPSGMFIAPIAPYKMESAGRHRIFHFPESSAGAQVLALNLERSMALLTSWLGPLELDRGLTIAEIPEFFGSQSGLFILQTSGAFNNPDQHGEFYHELSHLWNPRDLDRQPSRWNEGLAMFLQGLVEDRMLQQDHLDRHLESLFSMSKTALAKDERLTTVSMIDYGKHGMTDRSYSIGALFFGLLHHRVGERALLEFIADYSAEHRVTGSKDRVFATELVTSLGEGARRIVEDWYLTPAFTDKLAAAESWEQLKRLYGER